MATEYNPTNLGPAPSGASVSPIPSGNAPKNTVPAPPAVNQYPKYALRLAKLPRARQGG